MWVSVRNSYGGYGFWHLLDDTNQVTLCGLHDASEKDLECYGQIEQPAIDVCGFCKLASMGHDPVFGNTHKTYDSHRENPLLHELRELFMMEAEYHEFTIPDPVAYQELAA